MKNILSLAFMLLAFSLFSQSDKAITTTYINPDLGELYRDDVVPRIDITIDADTLAWLFKPENQDSDIEFSARFIFNNGTITDTIYPVGFRLRGNTSRQAQKKSFKISFNRFEQGAKYYGVEKLNLNGEHNDPSVMRSKIGWDIMRKLNVPATRSNHIQLYVNGNYYGIYINVEHIDEEFAKSRFTYNYGNLYKCLWPADLNYIGNNPDDYKFESDGHRAYALKINEETDDYSGLAKFIDVLNNASNSTFMCRMDTTFSTASYLKIMAAEIILGHWDNYIYNKNNYYLYDNPLGGKFNYIPYDLDNTLGVDWMNVEWKSRNIYNWSKDGAYAPLYERIMENQELRNQYSLIMRNITEYLINLDSLISAITIRKDMIKPLVADDPFYPLDYGYNINDFENSYTSAIGDHVKEGIFPYFEARFNTIAQQLENNNASPIVTNIDNGRISDTEIWVNTSITFQNSNDITLLTYQISGDNEQETTMYDDGLHYDVLAGDGIYGAIVGDIPSDKSLTFQITSTDNNGLTSTMPCYPIEISAGGGENATLFINEFMASNSHTIADEHGDYDDWIEIYNPEDDAIWLGDKYLTDNLAERDKWQFPDTYIESGEFLIIWADNDPEDGPLHTNFKLSKDGEEIGLFTSNLATIDEYIYGEQTTDKSEGRLPNGDDNWIFFDSPTPGASNQSSDILITDINTTKMYPNPANGDFIYLSEKSDIGVYNVYGQMIFEGYDLNIFNISHYNKGIYIVVLNNKDKLKLIVN